VVGRGVALLGGGDGWTLTETRDARFPFRFPQAREQTTFL
jgi:hypothetical protein